MTASEHIDQYIERFGDWRGERLAQLRALIRSTAPALNEEWKWNSPVWSGLGNVVGICAFKSHVKVNFFEGSSLADPDHVFNAGLDAQSSRSLDLQEADPIPVRPLQELIRIAVALREPNLPKKAAAKKKQ